MTLIAPPKSRIKPPAWNFDPALVEPRWRGFWDAAIGVMPCWSLPAFDLVSRERLATVSGTPALEATRHGLAIDLTSAEIDYQTSLTLSATGKYTLAAMFRIDEAITGDFDAQTVVLGDGDGMGMSIDASSGAPFLYTNGGNTNSSATGKSVTDGEVHLAVITWDQDAGVIRHWVDGVHQYEVTGYTDTSIEANPRLSLGRTDAGATGLQGPIFWGGAWERLLYDAEIRDLATDPFGPFRPARRRRVFVAAGGLDNSRLADMAFCRGRMRFGPGRLPVPDGTID